MVQRDTPTGSKTLVQRVAQSHERVERRSVAPDQRRQRARVRVDLEDGDLVIRGERRAEPEVAEEDYSHLERSVGAFHRRLPLPFPVPPEQIQARLTDGVLEVRLPKPAGPAPEPTRIPVR